MISIGTQQALTSGNVSVTTGSEHEGQIVREVGDSFGRHASENGRAELDELKSQLFSGLFKRRYTDGDRTACGKQRLLRERHDVLRNAVWTGSRLARSAVTARSERCRRFKPRSHF